MHGTVQLRHPSVETRSPSLGQDADDGRLVRSPAEMAAALWAASRSEAKLFAVAMHERACAEDDDARRAFWSEVIEQVDATMRPSRDPIGIQRQIRARRG